MIYLSDELANALIAVSREFEIPYSLYRELAKRNLLMPLHGVIDKDGYYLCKLSDKGTEQVVYEVQRKAINRISKASLAFSIVACLASIASLAVAVVSMLLTLQC